MALSSLSRSESKGLMVESLVMAVVLHAGWKNTGSVRRMQLLDFQYAQIYAVMVKWVTVVDQMDSEMMEMKTMEMVEIVHALLKLVGSVMVLKL